MEFMELIEKRRSIRAFDASRKVTKEEMEKLVYAAIQAPSWKNSQTARYYAVLSDGMIEKVSAECLHLTLQAQKVRRLWLLPLCQTAPVLSAMGTRQMSAVTDGVIMTSVYITKILF